MRALWVMLMLAMVGCQGAPPPPPAHHGWQQMFVPRPGGIQREMSGWARV